VVSTATASLIDIGNQVEGRQFDRGSISQRSDLGTNEGRGMLQELRVVADTRTAHMDNRKINLAEKLATFSDYFSPRTVAQLNQYDVMVVKLKGEFVWHKHDETDDFFLVLKGKLDIQLRERTVSLGPGEMFIVPKGVEHRPVAEEEVHLLLIEPTGTPNTGDAKTAAPRRLA
jgi:mannose-6-phosphate isomerase-like protein (cupin superfamily)